ncbi:MAG: phosphate ABC transporter permease PstA [Syntrophomonadaceae bacterium]
MNRRKIRDGAFLTLLWASGLFMLFVLASVLIYLLQRGGRFISREFILGTPGGFPLGSEGGILPAIQGTLMLVFLALCFSVVPALITAIFLSEYGRNTRFAHIINLLVQSMAGIPSIITGLFVYALCVVEMGWGICLLAGGLALGIMIFPVITVSCRDALMAVNDDYRLSAESLGASRSYTLRRIILPQATTGILSGILLGMGYAAGATAPIMVTAAAIMARSPGNLFEPIMALPYHLYILFNEHISMDQAYATALVLVLLLLLLNSIALWLNRQQERKQYR